MQHPERQGLRRPHPGGSCDEAGGHQEHERSQTASRQVGPNHPDDAGQHHQEHRLGPLHRRGTVDLV